MDQGHSLYRMLMARLFTAILAASILCGGMPFASLGAHAGDAIPAVKQVNVNELLNFLAGNHGKVILVNFFAAFCGPCRKEIPELMRLRKEIPEKDLLIVGVAIDESLSEASRFIKSLGIQDAYPAFYGGDEVSRAYRIDAIPFNVIYNREGHIEASEAGYVPVTELKKFLMTLIRR